MDFLRKDGVSAQEDEKNIVSYRAHKVFLPTFN